MDIEVRHLRYFVAVAEEGSFTAAARRVHVSQQVLSTQIQQLETILGVGLLERSSRGAAVTAAGASFLEGARSTLAELDRAASAARNSAQAIQGVLPVGLSVAASGDLPTRILAAFQREEPAVEIRLHSFELTHPAGGLLDRSTDMAFVRPPIRAAGIKLATLAEEPRVFVLPAGHPLAARDSLRLSDTEALPWVAAAAATDGCHPTAWRDDWLMSPRPGGGQPVIGATARTIDEWREYVVAGRGISLCPASAETFHARPGLTFVPGSGVPATPLCLAWRAGDTSRALRRFIMVARETAGASGVD
ncbi:MAG: LysR family transcriptional regulator [Streptosporangiaceae bacterium]